MNYFPANKEINTYDSTLVLYGVGENKDSYNISVWYSHCLATDNITYQAKVIKNLSYYELPKNQEPVKGKKYCEVVFEGKLKECYDYIDKIALAEADKLFKNAVE